MPPAAEPVKVRIVASGEHLLAVGDGEWATLSASSLEGSAARGILDTGWVVEANEEPERAELMVHVVDYQSGGASLLTLLTAFAIPGFSDHFLEVRIAYRPEGIEQRECTKTAETRTWFQTLLIFAYPFRSPAAGRMKTVEALAVGCLVEVMKEVVAGPGVNGRADGLQKSGHMAHSSEFTGTRARLELVANSRPTKR